MSAVWLSLTPVAVNMILSDSDGNRRLLLMGTLHQNLLQSELVISVRWCHGIINVVWGSVKTPYKAICLNVTVFPVKIGCRGRMSHWRASVRCQTSVCLCRVSTSHFTRTRNCCSENWSPCLTLAGLTLTKKKTNTAGGLASGWSAV